MDNKLTYEAWYAKFASTVIPPDVVEELKKTLGDSAEKDIEMVLQKEYEAYLSGFMR